MEIGTFFTLVLAVSCGLASAQWGEEESNSSTSTVPVVSPTATPTPPNLIVNKTFTLNDTNNATQFCLRMTAAISVRIHYTNSTNANVTTDTVALTDSVSINSSDSYCTASATKARLHIFLSNDDDDMIVIPIDMVFTFTGDNRTGATHWEMGNMTFILNPSDLDNYNASNLTHVEFNTTDKLHQDPNSEIEFSRSYKCDSNQELNFTEEVKITPLVNISQLQVQVFSFTNATSGEFDNARVCLLDTAGTANKIVPIAVGAALAGLVVVVLIAYLIGRLRSRRQSSYEALS